MEPDFRDLVNRSNAAASAMTGGAHWSAGVIVLGALAVLVVIRYGLRDVRIA